MCILITVVDANIGKNIPFLSLSSVKPAHIIDREHNAVIKTMELKSSTDTPTFALSFGQVT